MINEQSSPHHSNQDACGKGHLVERSKGPSQVCGGHFLDVERIKTHHQAAEQTKHQPSQDENFKRLAGFGSRHQTRSHHRETVHYEDGVTSGGEDGRNEKTKIRNNTMEMIGKQTSFCLHYLP